MKIVIPGGSGQIGTILARHLVHAGHEVVVLSRNPREGPWRAVPWDGHSPGPWAREIDGADAVINLAGQNVNCRYNPENRRLIMDSRINSVHAVAQAIGEASRPPPLWLQASTATIYAHRFDANNDEATGILGGAEVDAPAKWRFSIDVAKHWELAAVGAVTPHTRKVLLRSAMTMSPDHGGIFDVLMKLVWRGLGGRAGDGRQYISWIHERDFLRVIDFIFAHPEMEGPVNVCAPSPLPNSEIMAVLRRAARVRIGLPAGRWMLEIGAIAMRTETELVLKSRRVVPGRLLGAGFTFEFPAWPDAAAELVPRWYQRGATTS